MAEPHSSPPEIVLPAPPGRRRRRGAAAHETASPLWAVLAFTFLNSMSGGVVTTGFMFIARSAYGFTAVENYSLGLLQGITYIIGALTVGPVLRRAVARFNWLTGRKVLVALMIVLAAGCFLPIAVRSGAGAAYATAASPEAVAHTPAHGAWALWVLIALYSLLTGVLWPMVESYLSGGRAGKTLGSTVGMFNIVWSSALVAAFWLMAPLVKPQPLLVVAAAGMVHLISVGLLPFFRRDPGHHADYIPEPHPPVYKDLLAVFRLELPASYLVYSALQPYLPTALGALGVAERWHTPVAATWLLTRVLTFLVLQRWHGWHGKWSTAIVGGVLLLGGFGAAILAPAFLEASAALPTLIAGLAVFGVGMGAVYAAALYYAMEVGSAKVDAGGVHEALIGVGYGGGPVCGLLAAGVVASDLATERSFEPLVLLLVALVSGPVVIYAVSRALRRRMGRGAGQ